MEQVIGRAGFHVEHTKKVSERGAILHEMMRELDDSSIEYWAARNPNIVVADERLNEAMVNDGNGGFRPCTDRQEVLAYGAERVRRVKRKFTEDRYNSKTKKMQGGTVTATLIVSHLPKSMCIEVPNYYPVIDRDTGAPALDIAGQPKMRSRWVARDRDEARQYFEDVLGHLTDVAIPGGGDGVLGYDIQHSESTPHIQILADTFAPDPKDEDALRVETSRYWFSHRDVKDEHGKQKTGRTKMREYHAGLKEHLLDLGYDISPDFDEARHMVGLGKEEYGQAMDAQKDAQERAVAVRTRETMVKAAEKELEAERAVITRDRDAARDQLAAAQGDRKKAAAELEMVPTMKRRALRVARDEAKAEARRIIDEAKAEAARAVEDARAEAVNIMKPAALEYWDEQVSEAQEIVGETCRRAYASAEQRADADVLAFINHPGVRPSYEKFIERKRQQATHDTLKPLSERYRYQFEDVDKDADPQPKVS